MRRLPSAATTCPRIVLNIIPGEAPVTGEAARRIGKSLADSGGQTYFARMTESSRRSTRGASLAAVSFACMSLFISASGRAENWPQWRGPYFNGSTTEKDLPTQWSKTENVAWAAPLPG